MLKYSNMSSTSPYGSYYETKTTTNDENITFDDVLLKPQYSTIKSRSMVSTETEIGPFKLSVPVISANMDTVTGVRMGEAMWAAGGLGILHRYMFPGDVVDLLANESLNWPVVPSVGVGANDRLNAERYVRAGAQAICIDIAHGHSEMMGEMIKFIRKLSPSICIIAGNIATGEGAAYLAQMGANVVKLGIGPGSRCTTRSVTGHGVPQLSAIIECSDALEVFGGVQLIADGGFKTPGDIAKALAAGADAIMSGYMFAGCNEAPIPGSYRGMASSSVQELYRGKVSNDAPEGVSSKIATKGPAEETIKQIAGGLRSAFSYTGAQNLLEFQVKAKFIKVSSHTHIENGVRE